MKFIFFFIIIISNLLIFINFKKISNYFQLYDNPNKRKIHSKPIPSIGGMVFLYNFLIFIIYDFIFIEIKIFDFFIDIRSHISLIFLSLGVYLVGLKDDFQDTDPYKKIFLFSIIIFVYFLIDKDSLIQNLKLESFTKTISIGNLSLIFTVLCVAAFMNAFNMFDGINNQSSIFILIFSLYIFLISKNVFLFLSIFVPWLVFSIKNYKNQVFLGNNGTYFLSFLFSIYLIKYYNLGNENIKVEIIICILLVPILDMLRLFVVRFKKRQSPFIPDKLHIHHLLLRKYGLIKTNLFIFINLFIPMLIFYFFEKQLVALLSSVLIYLILYFFFIRTHPIWKKN